MRQSHIFVFGRCFGDYFLKWLQQMKAARALLGWSQDDLAREAGVSVPTVKRLEAGDGELGGRSETVRKLRSAHRALAVSTLSRLVQP